MANVEAINRAVAMLREALDEDERTISLDSSHAIVVIEGRNGERKLFATAPTKILSDTMTPVGDDVA
jgi:hypothetical protein